LIQAADLFELAPARRKSLIESCANILITDSELERARKISDVINTFVSDYFELSLKKDLARPNGSVLNRPNLDEALASEIACFKPIAFETLKACAPPEEDLVARPANVYQLAGAVKLSAANNATRQLSTKMGLLWERLANISPYAINPEAEFSLKVKGIDLIARNFHTGVIEYQQLKTQKNTLTGSQRGRSVSELSVHDNAVFCTAFSLGAWTFNHESIPRIAGVEFWERIGIDYSVFEEQVKLLVSDLEITFSSL